MRWTLLALMMLAGCGLLPTVYQDGTPSDLFPDDDPAEPGCEERAWYADGDGDSHGDPDAVVWACEAPDRTVATADDCDDRRAEIRPGADELCDGIDQDCDGVIDEDAIDPTEFFADSDGDGFGTRSVGAFCEAPAGATARPGDCNDADPNIHPDAPEPVCSLVDLDCDDQAGSAATQGGKRYETIQAAIDEAPDRAQVLVCPGVHIESLSLSKGVRLASTSGDASDTRILAPPGQRALDGHGETISLRGLTFAGRSKAEVQEGGIVRLQSHGLDIQDCRFLNGRALSRGGAIWWQGELSSRGAGASLTLEDVVVAANQSATDGGALYLQPGEGGGVRFDDVLFRDNVAGRYGGAVFVEEVAGSATTWNASASVGNAATRGGALYTVSSGAGSATTVLASSSTDDAGGGFHSGRRLVLEDVTIQGSTGAAAVLAPRVVATDVEISDAALWAIDADELTLEDSALLGNAVGARASDDLRFINVDVGSGSSGNGSDVGFAGKSFNFAGVVDVRCSGSGCVEL